MQLIAETYEILKTGLKLDNAAIARYLPSGTMVVYNHSSWISRRIFLLIMLQAPTIC